MKRRRKLFIVGSLALLVLAAHAEKPNFLFIIADDCTHRDIGCYGGQAHTPNIDKLASEGMRFARCFQTAPMCSPTRHSIYTGLYPVKSGAYCNHTFAKDDVKSVVHYLKPLGYRVALSGKSHVGPAEVFPFEWSKNKKPKDESIIDMDAVDRFMAECADKKTPFALFACSNEPHFPWSKGKEFREQYDPAGIVLRPYMVDTPETRTVYRNYLAEISFFDREVKTLLDMLEKRGLADTTMVVLVTEQGNEFPFAKWSCYDSGLQSAMIIRWPGKVKPGSETDAMVEYVDVLPTFVEAAGGTPAKVLDGKSMLPVLRGETDHHKDYVFGLQTSRGIYAGPHDYGIRSIRDDRYKLIWNLDPKAEFQNSVRSRNWFKSWQAKAMAGDAHAKWVIERYSTRPEFELYDVKADPYELNNLAGNPEYTETTRRLKQQLDAWMASQGDKGQDTELAAFEHMVDGNNDYRQWAKQHNWINASKKHPFY